MVGCKYPKACLKVSQGTNDADEPMEAYLCCRAGAQDRKVAVNGGWAGEHVGLAGVRGSLYLLDH